jgi:uncharacterized protein (TIGR03437 family)
MKLTFLVPICAATLLNAQSSPVISSAGIVNAASYQTGSIAPGELVTIYGTGIGPQSLVHQSGATFATQLASTSVFFANVAAPLIYVSSGSISAIVPYEVAGLTSVPVQVQYQSAVSNTVNVPVAKTALGIFAANSSGTGPGAILKSDYSLNTTANPSVLGSAILIYATGEGATSPSVADGTIDQSPAPQPLASPTVSIGGLSAQVLYAGGSPGLVAGLLQVNALIPMGLNTCLGQLAFPVVLSFGDQSSPSGLTVQVMESPSCNSSPAVQSVTLSSSTLLSGNSTLGQVNLSTVAPIGGTSVALTSSSTNAVVPSTVTVPAGYKSASFPITTSPVTVYQVVTITASYGGSSAKASLSLNTNVVSTPKFTTLDVIGTYIPSDGSPSGGMDITITPNSDNTYTGLFLQVAESTIQYLKGTLSGSVFTFTSVGQVNFTTLSGATGALTLTLGALQPDAFGNITGSYNFSYTQYSKATSGTGTVKGTYFIVQ